MIFNSNETIDMIELQNNYEKGRIGGLSTEEKEKLKELYKQQILALEESFKMYEQKTLSLKSKIEKMMKY